MLGNNSPDYFKQFAAAVALRHCTPKQIGIGPGSRSSRSAADLENASSLSAVGVSGADRSGIGESQSQSDENEKKKKKKKQEEEEQEEQERAAGYRDVPPARPAPTAAATATSKTSGTDDRTGIGSTRESTFRQFFRSTSSAPTPLTSEQQRPQRGAPPPPPIQQISTSAALGMPARRPPGAPPPVPTMLPPPHAELTGVQYQQHQQQRSSSRDSLLTEKGDVQQQQQQTAAATNRFGPTTTMVSTPPLPTQTLSAPTTTIEPPPLSSSSPSHPLQHLAPLFFPQPTQSQLMDSAATDVTRNSAASVPGEERNPLFPSMMSGSGEGSGGGGGAAAGPLSFGSALNRMSELERQLVSQQNEHVKRRAALTLEIDKTRWEHDQADFRLSELESSFESLVQSLKERLGSRVSTVKQLRGDNTSQLSSLIETELRALVPTHSTEVRQKNQTQQLDILDVTLKQLETKLECELATFERELSDSFVGPAERMTALKHVSERHISSHCDSVQSMRRMIDQFSDQTRRQLDDLKAEREMFEEDFKGRLLKLANINPKPPR